MVLVFVSVSFFWCPVIRVIDSCPIIENNRNLKTSLSQANLIKLSDQLMCICLSRLKIRTAGTCMVTSAREGNNKIEILPRLARIALS